MSNEVRRLKRNTRLSCEGFPNHSIWVTRAAKDGSWVDVFVYDNQHRTSWTKRMPLPLSDSWAVVP